MTHSTVLPPDYTRAFKEADIRGTYPKEINEAVAYAVAQGMVELFGYTKLVVGRDMRLSSPALHKAFIAGATTAGAQVIDLGLVATPQLYFASGSLKLPGVMITASHSPAAYNGLKLVHAEAVPFTATNGLRKMQAFVTKGKSVVAKKPGKVVLKNLDKEYLKFVLKGAKPTSYQGVKIATDIGNGMAHDIVPLLASALPITFDTLFAKLDGRFPNRDSDPNLTENQRALDAKLDVGTYDFGISFDGDADRIAFLDENGIYVNSAIIGAIIAERILKKEPGAVIASTNLNSRIYEETIKRNKGRVVMAKTGHTFVKEAMRKRQSAFGCEYSGHFFFRDFYYTDSVVLTLRYIVDTYVEAKKQRMTFSQMVAPYRVYEQTEDIVIKVANRELAMEKVFEYLMSLKPKSIKHFDGYFVDFGDVWGAVKPSVTEYGLKLMFESGDAKHARKLQRQVATYIKSIAKDK